MALALSTAAETYLESTDALPAVTGPLTYVCFIRVSSTPSETFGGVVDIFDFENHWVNAFLYHAEDFIGLEFWCDEQGGIGFTDLINEDLLDKWLAIAVTRNGANTTFRIREYGGSEWVTNESGSSAGVGPYSAELMTYGSERMDRVGTFDAAAFKLWDAVLDESEIEAECNSIAPVRTANLNRYTPLTGVDVSAHLLDASGNGRHWTANGTPTIVDGPSSGGGPIQETGILSAAGEFGSQFRARATAAGSITAGVSAGAAMSARAAAVASITAALEVGDADSAARAAQRVFAAQVSTDAQYAAIAQAAAAIQAGLEAGEVWAAIAAAEAGLIAGAELGATFAGETESAQTAALEAGTEAAAQFLGAVAAFGLLEAGASASDAFAASARISASISDAAQFGASFTTASLNDAAFSAATSLQSAFASEAAAIANFSAQASVEDAYSAISVALAAINIGVVLDATFSATSSADVSIVGATASVRAIRRLSATVRAIRPTATLN